MPTKFDVPQVPGARPPPPPPPGVVARPPPAARTDAPLLVGTIAPAADGAAAPAQGPALQSKRAAEIAVASLLLALGVLVIGASVRMGIGWGSDGPEGGFVPFWLAIVLVLCAATIGAKEIRRGSRERFATREQLVCVLKVLVPAAAMIALTPFIGLYAASVLYMAAYMRLVGRYSWRASVAFPLALMVLVFLVFERWFLVPLPKGPIEALFGY